MAKKQTRRSISFNRDVYDAIVRAAEERGVSMAEYLTELLREAGVHAVDTTHQHVEDVRRSEKGRALARRRKAQGFSVAGVHLAAIEVPT